jgi:hypothetical protein
MFLFSRPSLLEESLSLPGERELEHEDENIKGVCCGFFYICDREESGFDYCGVVAWFVGRENRSQQAYLLVSASLPKRWPIRL